MSKALESFNLAITDAEELLNCYDQINQNNAQDYQPPEALKRASLILVLTAWETYVEDIATELFELKFGVLKGSQIGNFMEQQFSTRLKMFHNPDSVKTKQIFQEFFGVDVTESWVWNNYSTPKEVRTVLNQWISKRGDAVHRANTDKQATHIVKRNELDKCIFFFKSLVRVTDEGLSYA
ncbi:HEPN domain-containing protein [Vibrio sp. Of7-15]|uniref:HEPN domain-containing protein n=1 Tax=Vibrio sp. Of7-15 TaxID=2724879 RepID=UPI001EF2C4C2|nr:HEPN domain-containing protein [Vibrio sp. Of7-15]MCG7500191.1 HEPN domain-containing protein [Vibrio sp. Of7-15]